MDAPHQPYAKAHKTVGVLGGGQLGRMLASAAQRLGCVILPLDPTPNSPAGQVCPQQLVGDFRETESVLRLADQCDVLTVEIEHVNASALLQAQQTIGVEVHPSVETLRLIQDKMKQKEHMVANNVPVADFRPVINADDVRTAGEAFGYPLILKSRTNAYDGRGNYPISKPEMAAEAVEALGSDALYVEQWVEYEKELAVMVVRGVGGDMASYPVTETIQRESMCHAVLAPAQIPTAIQDAARRLAEQAVACLTGAGVFGVELFLTASGQLLVNEIAPRPHNSGHYTIEACYVSQFENHLRAILGLPLGNTNMRCPASVMVNAIGSGSGMEEAYKPLTVAMSSENAFVHWYGKTDAKKGRKMGHVTFTGNDMSQLIEQCKSLELLDETIPSKALPLVGVIMGSVSDLPTMKDCVNLLDNFKIPHEVTVVSAHRTPERLMTYAQNARGRGLKVIIAAAGGAAHLPGMTAALTSLPVIGVPVALSHLDGVDSLYSICQMPRGVPVATVAINNSTNAALLAIRILGTGQPLLLDALEDYQKKQESDVLAKAEELEQKGWREILNK